MRLTLRTLLAYLDDRLPPANARELGQKISASPFARELAERIKGVVRKRRLASDDAGQKKIDANLIAEYLDDQLTPELVALIEKEILASDHSLAEVAATHQILGLLVDPLEVDEKLRKRLYQMDPVAEAEAGGARTEAEISASEDWKPLAPASSGSRRSPMLVLALMVFGWLALMFFDRNLYRQPGEQSVAVVDANNPNEAVDLLKAKPVAIGDPSDVKADTANSDVAKPPQVAAANGDQADPIDPAAAKPMSETDQAIAMGQALANPPGGNDVLIPKSATAGSDPAVSKSTDVVGSPDNADSTINDSVKAGGAIGSGSPSIAMADSAGMVGEAKDDGSGGEVNPNAGDINAAMDAEANAEKSVSSLISPHTFVVDDSTGALMLSNLQVKNPDGLDDQPMDWFWASTLEGKNNWNNLLSMRIACVAAPFSTTVGCQASGWRIQAVGSSVFQGIDEKYAGLTVLHGRYILTRTVAADPEPFLLEVGGQQLLLNPTDTNQRVAITVSSMPNVIETSGDEDVSLLSKSAAVLVTFAAFNGSTTVQLVGSEEVATVSAGDQLLFRTDGDFNSKTAKQSPMQWEWVLAASNPIPAAQTGLQKALLKKLKVYDSVREAVAAVAEDDNPMVARWAVQIPAAERDVEQLIRLLFDSEQQVVRSEAFYALQRISRTVPGGNTAIIGTLETRLNVSEMQQAMRMIQEISRISLEDRLTSEWLVDQLGSDRLVLREMAISTLEQHLNTTNNYFANESKNQRDRAVRRWKSALERNDGRLILPVE